MRRRMAAPISTGRALAVVLLTCVMMGVGNLALNAYLFRALCDVIVAQTEVFREVPPSTPTGMQAQQAWLRAARVICRV